MELFETLSIQEKSFDISINMNIVIKKFPIDSRKKFLYRIVKQVTVIGKLPSTIKRNEYCN